MLQITIPAVPDSPPTEFWDAQKEEFIEVPGVKGFKEQKLQLEHSLVSLKKWESKWCKPFLSNDEMTEEETLDYIRCMTITQNVPPEVYKHIPSDVLKQIEEYISAPLTATWFSEDAKKGKGNKKEIVTAEIIYFWMISHNVPPEYQRWHLNSLITLIRVCGEKSQPPKKMSKREIMNNNAALNAARKKKLNTKG